MLKPRFLTVAGIIFAAAAARLVPHPWNFTPVAAIALFGGASFTTKRQAFFVPLAALFVSDLVIGLHNTMLFVYAGFSVSVVLGLWLRRLRSVLSISACALLSSCLFFLLTNFGVWMVGGLYPRTFSGLAACFIAALPFFTNTVLGDLIYTALLFGGFTAVEKAFPVIRGQVPSLSKQVPLA